MKRKILFLVVLMLFQGVGPAQSNTPMLKGKPCLSAALRIILGSDNHPSIGNWKEDEFAWCLNRGDCTRMHETAFLTLSDKPGDVAWCPGFGRCHLFHLTGRQDGLTCSHWMKADEQCAAGANQQCRNAVTLEKLILKQIISTLAWKDVLAHGPKRGHGFFDRRLNELRQHLKEK